ncbi:hypothetical protein DXG01_012312 [Tephrocybe rancida]|nr:hypothetical protein DXG01_012312 [Tephrocybe rancida]
MSSSGDVPQPLGEPSREVSEAQAQAQAPIESDPPNDDQEPPPSNWYRGLPVPVQNSAANAGPQSADIEMQEPLEGSNMAQQQQHQQPADDENPDDSVRAQTESSSPPGARMGGNRQGPLFSPANSDSHLDDDDGHLGDAEDNDVFGLRHIPQLMGELNQAYIDLAIGRELTYRSRSSAQDEAGTQNDWKSYSPTAGAQPLINKYLPSSHPAHWARSFAGTISNSA